jgi:hypothetical protein
MKLSDALRRNRDGDPLDERAAAEMQALDYALRGEPVGPEMSSLATLVSDLRAEREDIDQEFSASLDAWAAAGFPRGQRPGAGESSSPNGAQGLQGPRNWFTSTPPRRIFAPAFAAASVIVIAAVAISQSGNISGGSDSPSSGSSPSGAIVDQAANSAESSGDTGIADSASSGSAGAGAAIETTPRAIEPDAAPSSEALKRQVQAPLDSFSAGDTARRESPGAVSGNLKKIQQNRKVERDAQLALAADPEDVPDVASRATDVTEQYDGHVLSSQVSGSSDSATATMELAIPSKNLDDAIADLSDLADVSSSSQGSDDITRPFISAREELNGFRAQRASVLKRLAAATTDQEEADLNAKLQVLNDEVANSRASVQRLQNKASISHVSLRISSDEKIGSGSGNDGGWDIGQAVHDAGHVLTVVAGVALISAAVLLPLAFLALLAGLAVRISRTRSRERALDE